MILHIMKLNIDSNSKLILIMLTKEYGKHHEINALESLYQQSYYLNEGNIHQNSK